MFFVGIDIGKRHHEAAMIDELGHPIGKPIRFSNTKAGSEKLLHFINKMNCKIKCDNKETHNRFV